MLFAVVVFVIVCVAAVVVVVVVCCLLFVVFLLLFVLLLLLMLSSMMHFVPFQSLPNFSVLTRFSPSKFHSPHFQPFLYLEGVAQEGTCSRLNLSRAFPVTGVKGVHP